MDGKWYSEKSISENATDLMISIIYLTRGNNESETKSLRLKSSWLNRHTKISKGEFAKVHCPSWISKKDDKYVLIKDNADKIKLIFDLYLNGYGVYSLIKELNKRDIKPFTKSKAWKPVFIHRLLQNPAVIGTYENVNPPVKNYYPPIITEDIFYKAIAQREQNVNFKGRKGDKEINIYGGICKCYKCGGNMVKYQCNGGKNKKDIKYDFLICSNSKVGKCQYEFTPFEKFNDSFLKLLNTSDLTSLLFSKTERKDNSEAIRGRLLELGKTIARVSDAVVKSDSPALVTRLTNLEIERKHLEKDYQTEIAAKIGEVDQKKEYQIYIHSASKRLKDNAFRLNFRNLIRKLISEVVVQPDEYTIYFNNKNCVRVVLNKTGFGIEWGKITD